MLLVKDLGAGNWLCLQNVKDTPLLTLSFRHPIAIHCYFGLICVLNPWLSALWVIIFWLPGPSPAPACPGVSAALDLQAHWGSHCAPQGRGEGCVQTRLLQVFLSLSSTSPSWQSVWPLGTVGWVTLFPALPGLQLLGDSRSSSRSISTIFSKIHSPCLFYLSRVGGRREVVPLKWFLCDFAEVRREIEAEGPFLTLLSSGRNRTGGGVQDRDHINPLTCF